MLSIKNLCVNVQDKKILNNFNLDIKENEIHVLMGLNGSGKSTICKVLMGDPNYKVVSGSIIYNGKDLLEMDVNTRSKNGIFLINQNPIEIEGVKNSEMLKVALENKLSKSINIFDFSKLINKICEENNIDKSFIHRDINFGMSGGEKKKNELLHMLVLEPSLVLIDEIDSGVDIDNLKIISNSLKKYFDSHDCSFIIVTHHNSILKKLKPDYVHIVNDGKIIKSGDSNLSEFIENNGFNETNNVSEIINNE